MITCDKCGGHCCKMLVVEIDTPETKEDYEDILWYLYHPGIFIYIDTDNAWNVHFDVKCKYLNEQGKCDIYSNRPPVCRNYLVEECDHNMEEIKVFFKTPEKYTEWLKTCRKYQELCRKEKAKNNRLNNKQ